MKHRLHEMAVQSEQILELWLLMRRLNFGSGVQVCAKFEGPPEKLLTRIRQTDEQPLKVKYLKEMQLTWDFFGCILCKMVVAESSLASRQLRSAVQRKCLVQRLDGGGRRGGWHHWWPVRAITSPNSVTFEVELPSLLAAWWTAVWSAPRWLSQPEVPAAQTFSHLCADLSWISVIHTTENVTLRSVRATEEVFPPSEGFCFLCDGGTLRQNVYPPFHSCCFVSTY